MDYAFVELGSVGPVWGYTDRSVFIVNYQTPDRNEAQNVGWRNPGRFPQHCCVTSRFPRTRHCGRVHVHRSKATNPWAQRIRRWPASADHDRRSLRNERRRAITVTEDQLDVANADTAISRLAYRSFIRCNPPHAQGSGFLWMRRRVVGGLLRIDRTNVRS